MNKKHLEILVACLLTALTVAAEPSNRPKTAEDSVVSWADCVRMAAQKNPDYLSAQKSWAATRAQYYGSFNGYSPTVTLNSSYNDSETHSDASRWGAGGSASMNLFNAGTNASIRSASASFRRADATRRVASVNLRNTLRQAFAKLMYAQDRVRVTDEIRTVRQENARMVTLKYESGRESKGNMLRSKAELTQAEADLASALRGVRTAQQDLSQALGEDSFRAYIGTGTWDIGAAPERPDLNSIVDQHPLVAAQQAARDVSYASLKSARADLWPYLSAQYSRSFSGDTYFPNDTAHWNASVGASYRLFGGGITSTYHAVSSAKRSLEKVDEDLRSTRNQVRSNLETSWANLANSLDQVNVQKQFLEAALQRNRESRIRYASGLMSFEDWELAVSDLVNYETGVIQAERDAFVAEAAWASATGTLLED